MQSVKGRLVALKRRSLCLFLALPVMMAALSGCGRPTVEGMGSSGEVTEATVDLDAGPQGGRVTDESPALPSTMDDPPSADSGENSLPPDLFRLDQRWTGDFDVMRERRVIRVLTTFSKTGYFLDGPRQRGVTFEALSQFEKFINEKLDTGHLKVHVLLIPVRRDELLSGLIEGRGDIAAANLTITPERSKLVDFSEPLMTDVDEVLVTGPAAPEVMDVEDLSGKEIYVRGSSSYHESLVTLNEDFRSRGRREMKAASTWVPMKRSATIENKRNSSCSKGPIRKKLRHCH